MRVAGSTGVIVCLNLFLLISGRKTVFFMFFAKKKNM